MVVSFGSATSARFGNELDVICAPVAQGLMHL